MDYDPGKEPTRWGAHTELQLPWKTWRIVSVIGEGSYGTVYEVVKIGGAFDERCAVKHISAPKVQTDIAEGFRQGLYTSESGARLFYQKTKERIINEIRLMQRFAGHSHIVNYHDYEIVEKIDEIGYDVFIRMDLLHSLADHLKQINADQLEAAIACLGCDICDGLKAIHRRNVLHRDIKPANILYGETGYKLADFGVAKSLDVTGSVTMAGTQNYMSPEIYKHQDGVNQTSDIYSLGIVMYRLLNGNRMPFLPSDPSFVIDSDMESIALGRRMRGETVVPISGVPGELMYIIDKACSFSPKDRYPTAAEMANALEQYLHTMEERAHSSPVLSHSAKSFGSDDPHDVQHAEHEEMLPIGNHELDNGGLYADGLQSGKAQHPFSSGKDNFNLSQQLNDATYSPNNVTQYAVEQEITQLQARTTGSAPTSASGFVEAESTTDHEAKRAKLAIQVDGVLTKGADNHCLNCAEVGDSILYSLSVTNTGNEDVRNIHLDFEDSRVTIAVQADATICLEPNQRWTTSANLMITQEDAENPEIIQTVTVSGIDTQGKVVSIISRHATRTSEDHFRGSRRYSVWISLFLIAVTLIVLGILKVMDTGPIPPTSSPTSISDATAVIQPSIEGTLTATADESDLGYDFSWPGSSAETYKISIRPTGSSVDMFNDEVQGTSFHVNALLPDTQYTVNVVNTGDAQENWTVEMISQSKKRFSDFGASEQTVYLLRTGGGDQSDYTFDQLHTMAKSKIFAKNADDMLIPVGETNFYLYLSWKYKQASTAHHKTVYYFLQTPSGEIYLISDGLSCNAADANTTWRSYFSINNILQIYQQLHQSIDYGTYTFQVYFDEGFFGSFTFDKSVDTSTATPTSTPTSTPPVSDIFTAPPMPNIDALTATPDDGGLGYNFSWPGTPEANYTITIRPAGSPRNMVYREVQGTSYHADALLPDTQYIINVANTADKKEHWTSEIMAQEQEAFNDFGASAQTVYLYRAIGGDQTDYSFDQLHAMAKSKIFAKNANEMLTPVGETNFYLYLSWKYQQASTAQKKTVSYFLRTPSGEIFLYSNKLSINAADKNTTWSYYCSINSMLQSFQALHQSVEDGIYTFSVYFDEDFFGRFTFKKITDTATPTPLIPPTPTLSATPVMSSINSLSLIPDTAALSCLVEWKDNTNSLNYEIALRPIGAPRDCFSTVVAAKSFQLENLLPDSQYSVTVTETKSRRQVTKVFQTGSVETYHIYHAVPNMANLLYITKENLLAAGNNELNAEYYKIQTIQADSLPIVYTQANYYVYLKWTFAISSDNHTTDILFFLQTPENELYYQKYTRSFDATPELRTTLRWYANVDDVIHEWRTEHPQITKGIYRIWVYFDHLFFRTNEFVVE